MATHNYGHLCIVLACGISYACFSQPALHLTQTLNYGKHIIDSRFSKTAPYSPQIYVYKTHPKEQIIEEVEVAGESDTKDSNYKPPVYVPPPPQVEYAIQRVGEKQSYNLGAGEFCEFLSNHLLISEDEGDTVFRKYRIASNGMTCIDSLKMPKHIEGHSPMVEYRGEDNICIIQQTVKTDSVYLTFYDTSFHKIFFLTEPAERAEINIKFTDADKFIVESNVKESAEFYLQEYSLKKGKQHELKEEMPGKTAWGVLIIPVNDTMLLAHAEMYSERRTYVYALNMNGTTYWQADIPDMTEEMTLMPGSKQLAVSFYNVQTENTIKFYSLNTGKYENTINLPRTLPAFARQNNWSVYMPERLTDLPGGKWVTSLVYCYSPNNQSTTSYYVLASDGKTTLAAKLKKNKSITSSSITPLSPNKFAVIIDDDIYYYSIF